MVLRHFVSSANMSAQDEATERGRLLMMRMKRSSLRMLPYISNSKMLFRVAHVDGG